MTIGKQQTLKVIKGAGDCAFIDTIRARVNKPGESETSTPE